MTTFLRIREFKALPYYFNCRECGAPLWKEADRVAGFHGYSRTCRALKQAVYPEPEPMVKRRMTRAQREAELQARIERVVAQAR